MYDIGFPNIGLYFENVPRIMFTIPIIDRPIFWYGFMIVVGIIAAYFMGIWWVKKTGQRVEDYTDLLLFGMPFALVGLRTHYLIFMHDGVYNLQTFFATFFRFADGGLAIYGGIFGAIVAVLIVGRHKKIPFATIADTGAPSMLLGQVIGRFGNFFNREAFGGYTDSLLAMSMRAENVPGFPHGSHITEEMLEHSTFVDGYQFIQVHPTFLYEAFFNLLLMIALLIYRPRKTFNGEIVLLYLFGYGVIRFIIESLRTDQMMLFNTGLPVNQVLAAGFAVICAALIIMGHVRARRPEFFRRKK
ncbi:MAG: prolipoprotein diacylglyceryl transferase [Defluviitaleaceae bacterium]|nr:prolipoprotein diacylglyceryl transferase [Defluviitaleaceae bacterium]